MQERQIDETSAIAATAIDVSFIMAAHNAAPFVAAAVGSALAQSGVAVEVIVVDDNSSDDTAERIAEIAKNDPRVTLLRRTRNGGAAAARNQAIAHAKGEWVAILDADDLVDAARSRYLLDLAAETDCTIVADNVLRFRDDDVRAAWPLLDRPTGDRTFAVDLPTYLRRNLLTGGDDNLGYLKPLISRSFLKAHDIAYDETLRIGEDFNLCLKSLAAGARFVCRRNPSTSTVSLVPHCPANSRKRM